MIEEIKRRNGKSYRVVLYDAKGERMRKTFRLLSLAKEWERRILRERDEQLASGIVLNDSQTLAAFCERWLKEKVNVFLSDSTRVNYERTVRVHLVPEMGHLPLREIRVEHANRLVSRLKNSGHAPKGINIILGVFTALLNNAVEWECLARNPLYRFKPVREPERHFDYWSANEIEQFLAGTMFDTNRPLYILALNTGMRRGELCGLKWDRIDFIRGQIVVSRSLSRYGLSESTKSGKKRHVPMNPVVKDLLKKLLERSTSDLVLEPGKSQPKDVNHVYREFHKAQRIAGFTRLIRFHDLRHTFASHFMMNGGNIYDLQKILGHSSLEMTQRYAHMSPDHLAHAIQIVSFGGESKKCLIAEERKQTVVSKRATVESE